MSLIEKALAKLQASRRTQQPELNVPRVTPMVERVVGREREALEVTVVPGGRRREIIGNPSKTVRIDYDALRQNGLLPPEHQQRELAHQYRNLKRPLIKHAFQPDAIKTASRTASPRLIMVTSALPGEGKTFTSINLALSLAMEKDHSVLLVDGDVARPRASHSFGVDTEPGLLDLLGDPHGVVDSLVLPTDVPGLSILPVGRRSEMANEMLASARMREVILQLERLDPQGLVVVDSPPILLTSEARVLASLFGQVVLIVKASSTPQQAVTEALGMIGEGPWIGLVLNQATHDEAAGSYYGYRYGYVYGDEGFASAAKAGAVKS